MEIWTNFVLYIPANKYGLIFNNILYIFTKESKGGMNLLVLVWLCWRIGQFVAEWPRDQL